MIYNCDSQTWACVRIYWRACENTDSWVPYPSFSDSGHLAWGHMTCVLTSSQVMRMLRVWEPHFENRVPTAKEGSRRCNFKGTFATTRINAFFQSMHLKSTYPFFSFLLYLILFIYLHLSFLSLIYISIYF